MPIDYSELKETFSELVSDIEAAKDLAKTHSDGFVKRTYVRAFFAMIEGLLFQFKAVCLQAHDVTATFSPSELALLKEISSELTDNGKVKEKSARLRLLPNLVFAIHSYAKAHRKEFALDKNNQGWAALQAAVKTRDRITHPKHAADVAISDDELMTVGHANEWFRDSVVELLDRTRV